MYSTLAQFQKDHPNTLLMGAQESMFQDHHGEDEDGNETFHPVMKRMLNGEAPSDIDLASSWRDDHEFCCLLMMTYEDETYLVSFWWMDPSFLLEVGKMIGNGDRARSFVENFYDGETLKRLRIS